MGGRGPGRARGVERGRRCAYQPRWRRGPWPARRGGRARPRPRGRGRTRALRRRRGPGPGCRGRRTGDGHGR
ncbi:methyl-CpG-binding protein [Streptomyces spectabilis]|uniref:Methyl-CpG-binding protein n=1 Tax=Streptomyces spectabilis TaxID=68270 RepID=A0A516RLM7_STRST|nr:methyl-CpG-binding protein [Streptomyces spectabilis]